MRKGDGVMKSVWIRKSALVRIGLLLSCLPIFAAVDGTVINGSNNQPAVNTIVSLVQPGQGGMQTLQSVKTDVQGTFHLTKEVPGTTLVQVFFDGVLYTKMIMPGNPGGAQVVVYDSSTKPETARVAQHFIVLQPNATAMAVSEGILYQGDPKLTFNDATNGTLHFYLPPEAKGQVSVTINALGGMPIQRPAEKTNQPNVYKVMYPIKPGETRFDLNYTVPLASPLIFSGKILHKDGASDLVIPTGVTIKGDDLELAGQEPKTQANIYRIKGTSYKVEVSGQGSLTPPAASDSAPPEEDNGAPTIQEVKPRIYESLYWILGMAFAILGLGSFLLYRNTAVARRG
jgi:hypothetical protein